MKKFIIAALATTIAASSMAAAPAAAAPAFSGQYQQRHTEVVRHQPGKTVVVNRTVTRQPQYRNWRKGERFDSRYARNYRQVDYRQYRGRLNAPPRGYHYVRSGNDAVLVGITSGLIGAVIAGAFN